MRGSQQVVHGQRLLPSPSHRQPLRRGAGMGHAVTPSEVDATDGADLGPVELFVPGRLCLFGEHSDWAGSYARHALCASLLT